MTIITWMVSQEKVSENEYDLKSKLLEKIQQLELALKCEQEENKRLLLKLNYFENNKQNKDVQEQKNGDTHKKEQLVIPKHLNSVHENHKDKLLGFKMRYCAIPKGYSKKTTTVYLKTLSKREGGRSTPFQKIKKK